MSMPLPVHSIALAIWTEIVKTKMACCRTRTRERIYFAFSGQAHRLLFHEQCHHLTTKDNRTKKQLDEAVCGLVLGRDRTDSHSLPAIVFETFFSSILFWLNGRLFCCNMCRMFYVTDRDNTFLLFCMYQRPDQENPPAALLSQTTETF